MEEMNVFKINDDDDDDEQEYEIFIDIYFFNFYNNRDGSARWILTFRH